MLPLRPLVFLVERLGSRPYGEVRVTETVQYQRGFADGRSGNRISELSREYSRGFRAGRLAYLWERVDLDLRFGEREALAQELSDRFRESLPLQPGEGYAALEAAKTAVTACGEGSSGVQSERETNLAEAGSFLGRG